MEIKTFEAMAVIGTPGCGQFCDNKYESDNGPGGNIADYQDKWQNLSGMA